MQNLENKIRTLIVDENNPCWNLTGMFHKRFTSDAELIRFYTVIVVKWAPEKMKKDYLLEQQISEVIKNAIYHGNKKDKKNTLMFITVSIKWLK